MMILKISIFFYFVGKLIFARYLATNQNGKLETSVLSYDISVKSFRTYLVASIVLKDIYLSLIWHTGYQFLIFDSINYCLNISSISSCNSTVVLIQLWRSASAKKEPMLPVKTQL